MKMFLYNLTSVNNEAIFDYVCFDVVFIVYMGVLYNCTYFFLVFPLSVTVLFLGFQRWKQKHFSLTSISHSDFFTYNMASMELIAVIGTVMGFCSIITQISVVSYLGLFIGSFPWTAQMMFPMLICVERYLAVVRPITYLRWRQAKGVRIRNICTTFIWLQCTLGVCGILVYITYLQFSVFPACLMAVCLITLTFCSLSVLCALVHQKPGKAGQDRMQMDRSKRRAFRIVLIITGVLFFRFGGNLVCYSLTALPGISHYIWCLATASGYWFTLPSSLVLPLLFLHRNGKIPGCKPSTK